MPKSYIVRRKALTQSRDIVYDPWSSPTAEQHADRCKDWNWLLGGKLIGPLASGSLRKAWDEDSSYWNSVNSGKEVDEVIDAIVIVLQKRFPFGLNSDE